MSGLSFDRTFLAGAILEQIMEGRANPRGMIGVMEDGETRAGHTVVPLGAMTPFPVPRADWLGTVISMDGKDARIVLVHAHEEGRGAFRRLVKSIQSAGYIPVVVEPVGVAMPAIMKKWGWRGRRKGAGFDSWVEHRAPRHP